jgi:hypothetical protein
MSSAHWFWTYTCCDGFRLITGGTGNHSVGKYWYKTQDELNSAKNRFIADGFDEYSHCQGREWLQSYKG